MTKRPKIKYTRQTGIIKPGLLKDSRVTLIGTGSVGSFTALTLGKMGVQNIEAYDEDGVSEHNLPNQFFRKEDVGQFKATALASILASFSDTTVKSMLMFYKSQRLQPVVIVATDSMSSRMTAWKQFKAQKQARVFIEARMGAELGRVITIQKNSKGVLSKDDEKFYAEHWYPDSKMVQLPCTARSIIYNVLMLASLICRAYKGVLTKEAVPRELVFSMTMLDQRSWMIAK
jgi:hypothetical protein